MAGLLFVRKGHCPAGRRVHAVGIQHDPELVQRLDPELSRTERQPGACARVAHPPRDLPGDANTGLEIEDLFTTTTASLDDPQPLPTQWMPRVGDGRQSRSVC